MARKFAVLVSVGAVVVFAWQSAPPNTIAFDSACNASGFWGNISEEIYGDTFWRRQLDVAQRNRMAAEQYPAKMERIEKEVAKVLQQAQESIEQLQRQHPNLPKPSPALERADALREQADALEFAEAERWLEKGRLLRIEWLQKCESAIRERIM